MWRRSPKAVHILLNRITKTFTQFCLKALDAGANGIFFATKWATKDLLTWEEYTELGAAYEMQMLNALNHRGAIVVLHVCGERTYLENMLDYQVDAISYDFFSDAAVDPESVVSRTGKQVIGGIDPELLGKDPKATADKCKKYKTIDKWIAGPSCVVPPGVSDQAIEEFITHLAIDHPRF
jgi:uroporphyrinogen decarboxylase